MSTQHTPTRNALAAIMFGDRKATGVEREYIMHRVNSHDALVEALQRILTLTFETSSRPNGPIGDAQAIARAALKAAQDSQS